MFFLRKRPDNQGVLFLKQFSAKVAEASKSGLSYAWNC
jgi:hypothetical protein